MKLTLPDAGSPLPVSVNYAKMLQDALYNVYNAKKIDSVTDPDGASINLNIVGENQFTKLTQIGISVSLVLLVLKANNAYAKITVAVRCYLRVFKGLLWTNTRSTVVQGNPCFDGAGNSRCSNICISSGPEAYVCDCFHGFTAVYQSAAAVKSLCRSS